MSLMYISFWDDDPSISQSILQNFVPYRGRCPAATNITKKINNNGWIKSRARELLTIWCPRATGYLLGATYDVYTALSNTSKLEKALHAMNHIIMQSFIFLNNHSSSHSCIHSIIHARRTHHRPHGPCFWNAFDGNKSFLVATCPFVMSPWVCP